MFDLNTNVTSWIHHVKEKMNLTDSAALQVEQRLRASIAYWIEKGLEPEEAFLVGAKRIAKENELSLSQIEMMPWKQLSVKVKENLSEPNKLKSILMIIAFSLLAGTLAKLPEWLITDHTTLAYEMLIMKNLSLFVLPLVALYLLIQHKAQRKMMLILMGIFGLTFILINLYPYTGDRNTEILTGLHVPLLLWLITGVAYLGQEWKNSKRRMDFIRFSGEAFIYGVLIYCGLAVLILFILLIFSSIQIDVSSFVMQYLIVYGSFATVLVTIYQVDKKNLMENLAPILAKIFSPLFLIAMVVFLLTIVFSGRNPLVDRNYLIAFDAMLILVLALVLYGLSARKDDEKTGLFDFLNVGLICAAMIIDGIALVEIMIRLSTFGITPNKIAALGENVLVLVNLGGLAIIYLKVIWQRARFETLERFQTKYLLVYAGWLAFVAFIFPILFGFH